MQSGSDNFGAPHEAPSRATRAVIETLARVSVDALVTPARSTLCPDPAKPSGSYGTAKGPSCRLRGWSVPCPRRWCEHHPRKLPRQSHRLRAGIIGREWSVARRKFRAASNTAQVVPDRAAGQHANGA
jgi:hypothetical protein